MKGTFSQSCYSCPECKTGCMPVAVVDDRRVRRVCTATVRQTEFPKCSGAVSPRLQGS